MKRSLMNLMVAGLLAACVAVRSQAQDITQAEKDKALRYLDETRARLADAVKGISDVQWKFKPGPDRWSIAEVVEHLAVLEEFFVNPLWGQIMQAPAGSPNADARTKDAMILAKVPDRSTKVKAPESITPTGRWTPQESLQHFLAARQETISLLESATNLRGHVLPHPALGPLDAYQWLLSIAAHTERHTKQILEVKADPHYPID